MKTNSNNKQLKISNIIITNDTISARGGLTLFLHYLENTKVFELIELHLCKIKGSRKGISTREFLIQLMAFIMDGSHNSLTYFDQLKSDDTYAALLEMKPERSASSHQIKRFFGRFVQTKNGVEIGQLKILKPAKWFIEMLEAFNS